MKHLTFNAILMLAILGSEGSMANAGVCGSKITTAETMLTKMNEATDGVVTTLPDGDVLWLRNFQAARNHLREARAYLEEGDEFSCNFHVAIAFRRLGVGR